MSLVSGSPITCNRAMGGYTDRFTLSMAIQPGKPTQNAYVEQFNRTVRHEWLDEHLFESIEHAQQTATDWLWRYNNDRPNMALGGITPKQKLALAA